MLRRLMAWCVPDRALRLHTDVDDESFARASTRGGALLYALTSHGLESLKPAPGVVPDTTARDERDTPRAVPTISIVPAYEAGATPPQ